MASRSAPILGTLEHIRRGGEDGDALVFGEVEQVAIAGDDGIGAGDDVVVVI